MGMLAALVALALAVALLAMVGPNAVLILLVALGALAVLGLAKLQVDLSVRLRRMDERVSRARAENAKCREAVRELTKEVRTGSRELSQVAQKVDHLHEQAGSARHPSADYRQVEALFGLYHLLDVQHPLPPMRGWAGSPDFLLEVVAHILSRRPRVVLECGSGVSTLLVAYALRHNQFGRVWSLEHHEGFVDETRELLDVHGLTDWAFVVHAPLEPVTLEAEPWWWYAPGALEPLDTVDVVVVDGPPSDTQALARYPVLPLVSDRLAQEALILLDDYKRDDERAVVERWLQEFTGFTCRARDHEKGTAVLSR